MGESRIKNYIQYGLGFDTFEGSIIVHVTYPQKWKVVEIEEGNPIKTFYEQSTGRQYYWIDDNMDLDVILDEIDETINLNKDLQARFDLLKEKVEELHRLFIEKDLEELRTMEFTFKKKKPKGKKALTNKKTEEVKAEIVEYKDETEANNSYIDNKVDELDETDSVIESDIDKKIAEAMKKNKRKTGE